VVEFAADQVLDARQYVRRTKAVVRGDAGRKVDDDVAVSRRVVGRVGVAATVEDIVAFAAHEHVAAARTVERVRQVVAYQDIVEAGSVQVLYVADDVEAPSGVLRPGQRQVHRHAARRV